VGGSGQRKQPTREGGRDDNDDTTVGSNGFFRRLKQQSTKEGGTRNERGDGDGGAGLRRLIHEERSISTTMGNQRAQTTPSLMDATGQDEVEGDEDEVGVEETMTTFLGRRGGRETHLHTTSGSDKRTEAAADRERRAVSGNGRRTAAAMEKERAGVAAEGSLCYVNYLITICYGKVRYIGALRTAHYALRLP